MPLTFEHPAWLLLALVSLPLGWVGLSWFRAMARGRMWATVGLRGLLTGLLAAVLAGAAGVRETDRVATIVLADVSRSVRAFAEFGPGLSGEPATEGMLDWVVRAAGGRGRDDLLGVVAFDGAAAAIQAARPGAGARGDDAEAPEARDLSLDVALAEGTNIAAAIRLARAMAPPDARTRLVLLSDGVDTAGDALAAALEAAGSGGRPMPIDVVPIAYGRRPEVMVEFVDAPPQAPTDSTITVRVGLRASPGGPGSTTTGTLVLRREGEDVDINGDAAGSSRVVSFTGDRHVELVEVELDDRAVHRFEAFFDAAPGPDGRPIDTLADNNRGEAFTATPGRGAVLVIDGVSEGDPRGEGATLPSALASSGLKVETVPPGAIPRDLLSLHAYDLVILQNVSADEVPRETQGLLADYVRELGGGLVMVGGPESFGAGSWKGTEVEQVLPVKLDLPEELIIPAAAIVLVLDNSGSMSQRVLGGMRTQQEIANDAVALAIETMDPGDLIGVIAFNSGYDVVAPLTPDSEPRDVARRVRAISSGGGTNLYPALRHAGSMLDGVKAQVKHVIVLSDGRSQGSPFEGTAIARELAARRISVSTIAIGDEADAETLAEIAREGGGTYHRVIDPESLPRVFFKEIRVVSRPLVREEPFNPAVLPTGSPMVAGTDARWPRLLGLTLTQRRPEPTITYAAQAPSGEPLLAHWSVGLGRVTAFTSDAHRWAAPWLDWPGYQTLWTQIARSTARPASTPGAEVAAAIEDDQLRITLTETNEDGSPRDLLSVPGILYAPDGEAREIRLSQTAPGTYEATLPATSSGSYVFVLTPRAGDAPLSPVIGGASRATSAELRRLRSDVARLREIAEATGGRVLDLARPEQAELFDRTGLEPARAMSPMWRLLLVWCVAIMLLDVASRRVAWDRLLTREVAEELKRHGERALQEQSDRAAATVSRLRGRSEEMDERLAGPSGASARGDALAPPAKRSRRPDPAVRPAAPARDEVAEAARRQELVRRALAARQSRGGGAGPGAAPAAPAAADKPARKEPGEGEGSTSGLLDAKRRVRERFGSGDRGGTADDGSSANGKGG